MTLIGVLTPVLILAWYKVIAGLTAVILADAGAILAPMLLYRSWRSWWLVNYYVFPPQHLPANRDPRSDGRIGDENR